MLPTGPARKRARTELEDALQLDLLDDELFEGSLGETEGVGWWEEEEGKYGLEQLPPLMVGGGGEEEELPDALEDAPGHAHAHAELAHAHAELQLLEDELRRLQGLALQSAEQVAQSMAGYAALAGSLDALQGRLHALTGGLVLALAHLRHARSLSKWRRRLVEQAALEHADLQLLSQSTPASVAAALVLVRGLSSPQVIRQGKPFRPGGLHVALRTGTRTGALLRVLGPVQAALLADAPEHEAPPALAQAQAPLDAQGLATFTRLHCPQGTRKRPVRLQFSVAVAVGAQRFLVQSEPSPPLIVLTNERQWRDAEGALLLRQALTAPSIPWAQCANVLALRYLAATKQRSRDPPRPLSYGDLKWLRQRGGLVQIEQLSAQHVATLWDWFGAALFRLRFQRGLLPLWLRGLVAGWLTRAEAEALLSTRSPGTFLVRFSEQAAGLLAIAYRADSGDCRHYLLHTQDLAARRSLADFLAAAHALRYVLQRSPTGAWVQLDKAAALAPFVSRSPPAPPSDSLGYDKRL